VMWFYVLMKRALQIVTQRSHYNTSLRATSVDKF